MDDDRVDADLLQQGDVAAELLREVLLAHRVAAVFHHHRRAGIAAQERQRVRQDMRLFGCRGYVDRGDRNSLLLGLRNDIAEVDRWFVHCARLRRCGTQGQGMGATRSYWSIYLILKPSN